MKDQESNPRPHTPRPAALPAKVDQREMSCRSAAEEVVAELGGGAAEFPDVPVEEMEPPILARAGRCAGGSHAHRKPDAVTGLDRAEAQGPWRGREGLLPSCGGQKRS